MYSVTWIRGLSDDNIYHQKVNNLLMKAVYSLWSLSNNGVKK